MSESTPNPTKETKKLRPTASRPSRGVQFTFDQKRAIAEKSLETHLNTEGLIQDAKLWAEDKQEAYQILEWFFLREAMIFGLSRRVFNGRSEAEATALHEGILSVEDQETGRALIDSAIDACYLGFDKQFSGIINEAVEALAPQLQKVKEADEQRRAKAKDVINDVIGKIGKALGVEPGSMRPISREQASEFIDKGDPITSVSIPVNVEEG